MRLCFGDFVLDDTARQLSRGGRAVHLTPKALELLELLIRKRPRAISKDEFGPQAPPPQMAPAYGASPGAPPYPGMPPEQPPAEPPMEQPPMTPPPAEPPMEQPPAEPPMEEQPPAAPPAP